MTEGIPTIMIMEMQRKCGATANVLFDGRTAKCILLPKHPGAHRDSTGLEWERTPIDPVPA